MRMHLNYNEQSNKKELTTLYKSSELYAHDLNLLYPSWYLAAPFFDLKSHLLSMYTGKKNEVIELLLQVLTKTWAQS